MDIIKETFLSESPPMFSSRILSCLKSPGGTNKDSLEIVNATLKNVKSGITYPYKNNVPSLFLPEKGEGEPVTTKVKSFYEENPFPNYEGLEEFGELVNKGFHNAFASELLKAVGYNKTILECGCGTGQLSHFLQLNNNHVLGIDMSLASLELAIEHKFRNGLSRSSFAQMNIFDLAIKDNVFDVVISHGVLHHTFDAEKAFSHLVKKVKPGGIIMIGLYNYYARVPTWIRSKLVGLLGQNIDYVVRNLITDEKKADTWIKDQYFNPHETWHSIDEVLEWFNRNDIEYLNCSPAILGSSGESVSSLFDQSDPGSVYQRLISQLSWLGTIAREGALFDVIGRKAK